MTSNAVSVKPVLPGNTIDSSSPVEEKVLAFADHHYIPEIAIIAVAICFILVFFLVLFPKGKSTYR